METRRFYVAVGLMLGVGLLALVLAVLPVLAAPSVLHDSPDDTATTQPARGRATDRYVATTGTDSGDCSDGDFPCRTVQYAVDQAIEGSVIKVASGVYTDVHARPQDNVTTTGSVTQVAYVSRSVTIRGGYTITNWTTSDRVANPTRLDAQGRGRGLYVVGDISPTIAALDVTGGDASRLGGSPEGFDAGGGVYVITASVTLESIHVSGSLAGAGGGVYAHASSLALHNSVITANVAGDGGGLYLRDSTPALGGNTIAGNTAHWAGGGLCLRGSSVVLSQTTVIANTGYLGGGGYLLGSDAILNSNVVISNSGGAGGGLYLEESTATLRCSTTTANQALRGGGLFLGFSRATLINGIIVDNQAENEGDGLYLLGSSAHLLHTTIARNGMTRLAAERHNSNGIYATTSLFGDPTTVALTNTIVVSHGLGITVSTGSSVTLEGMLWGKGAWANTTDWSGNGAVVTGTVNVRGDPAFVDPGNGDYHIHPTSAARDAGVDAGVIGDLDGDLRTDGHPDIGADEVVAALIVTKQADPDPVEAGARLTYTIRATNTGQVDLHATITDTLPLSVTLGKTSGSTLLLPGGMNKIIWPATITVPAGIWTDTVVVTVAEDYQGLLTNVVEIATEEGAAGIYTETATVITGYSVYLPLVMKRWPAMILMSGRVSLEDGTGLVGVGIYLGVTYGGPSGGWLVTTTDQNGDYKRYTNCPLGHDETLRVYAKLEGYVFEPEVSHWRTYGYCLDKRTDFVASQSTHPLTDRNG
jgi:uncharacterized repeat protein (TIGR01451 family)